MKRLQLPAQELSQPAWLNKALCCPYSYLLPAQENTLFSEQNGSNNQAAQERLEFLLSESVKEAIDRGRVAFDLGAAALGNRIVLFGAGGLGRRTARALTKLGIPPLAFADNNSALWGNSIEGVSIRSLPEAVKEFGEDSVFVITIWNSRANDRMQDRIKQLETLGCKRVLPVWFLFWKFPTEFLPCYPLDLPHKVLYEAEQVREAFDLFTDESSQQEFLEQLAFRLQLDHSALKGLDQLDSFFPRRLLTLRDNEVLIDCGAFDGDSIEEFVKERGGLFQSIIAFEPDPHNWQKLHERIAKFPDSVRAKIVCRAQALGAKNETVYFSSTGTDQARIGEGSLAVECVTLDDALRNSFPTLLKFDIEGAELNALDGARNLVATHRPVLAVSAYHEQNHLWRVPLKLAEICSDYAYFLVPHGTEGWDLVCYAVPFERLISL